MPPADKLWTKDFILLALASLLMSTGFYFLMPTLPIFIVDKLHAHKGQVGYILAAYTISAMLIRPFTGFFIDKRGRKWIYIFAFLIFSLTLGVYPLAASFLFLLMLRFFHGILWGISGTSGATLIVDVIPPPKRGQGIGLYGLSMTVAMAVGPVLALEIMGKSNYNAMFYSAMAVALGGFILLMFVRYPRFEAKNHEPFSFRNILEKRTLPTALVQFLYGITYGGIISFITLYAKDIGIQRASPFFLIIATGIFISRLWSGRVFDKKGPKNLVSGGILLLIAGFLVLSLLRNLYGFYFSAFLCGLGGGIIMPTMQAMANNVVEKHRRGAANATIITAFDLGIGTGSVVLGFLSEKITLGYTYLLCTIVLFIALIYFFFMAIPFYQTHRIKE